MTDNPPQEIRQLMPLQPDIEIIVGGNFTPDALSPEVYDSIVLKVKARPADYLTTFRQMFVIRRLDAETYSRLHLATFVGLVTPQQATEARDAAKQLVQI